MNLRSVHNHPRPFLNRVTQYGAVALLVAMALGAIGLLAVVLFDQRFIMLAFGSVLLLALMPPVVMLTTISPPLTVDSEGLTIRPVIWKERRVAWSEVSAFKDFPLLPQPDSEIGRKLVGGRKSYRAAAGKMLVIPTLPAIYRINGFFCGEGLTPVIAFTNRSHADYDRLLKKVSIYLEETPA